MPAGKLVFSGMEFVKSSRGGSSVRISVWRGTNTGGSTGEIRMCHLPSKLDFATQTYILYLNLLFFPLEKCAHETTFCFFSHVVFNQFY